jgi:putative FmdB family regulatory protein
MPIYEFECRKCKAHLEVFQKINDKPPVKCRKCGGRLEKQVSASAIQFKGTGWYVTDYASKAAKDKRSQDKAASSGDAGASAAEKGDSAGDKAASASPTSSEKSEKKETSPAKNFRESFSDETSQRRLKLAGSTAW